MINPRVFSQTEISLPPVLLHREVAQVVQPERPRAGVENTILPCSLTALLIEPATNVGLAGRGGEPGHLSIPALLGAPLPSSVGTALPPLLATLLALLEVAALPTLLAAVVFPRLFVLVLASPIVDVVVTPGEALGGCLHVSLGPDPPGTPP